MDLLGLQGNTVANQICTHLLDMVGECIPAQQGPAVVHSFCLT